MKKMIPMGLLLTLFMVFLQFLTPGFVLVPQSAAEPGIDLLQFDFQQYLFGNACGKLHRFVNTRTILSQKRPILSI